MPLVALRLSSIEETCRAKARRFGQAGGVGKLTRTRPTNRDHAYRLDQAAPTPRLTEYAETQVRCRNPHAHTPIKREGRSENHNRFEELNLLALQYKTSMRRSKPSSGEDRRHEIQADEGWHGASLMADCAIRRKSGRRLR